MSGSLGVWVWSDSAVNSSPSGSVLFAGLLSGSFLKGSRGRLGTLKKRPRCEAPEL